MKIEKIGQGVALVLLAVALYLLSRTLWDRYIDFRIERKFVASQRQVYFNKNCPWNRYSIEEKMYLCAYGSSGNRLDGTDLEEIRKKYGDDTLVPLDEDKFFGVIIGKKGATKPDILYFPQPKKLNYSAMDEAIKILSKGKK